MNLLARILQLDKMIYKIRKVVAVRVYATGTTAATTSNPVDYDGTTFDSHGAWNSNTFTCPDGFDGVFSVSVTGFTTTGNTDLDLYKNGSVFCAIANYNTTTTQSGTTLVRLAGGDTLDLRPASSQTFSSVSDNNHLSIIRVGD
jgi:hypothetical protein